MRCNRKKLSITQYDQAWKSHWDSKNQIKTTWVHTCLIYYKDWNIKKSKHNIPYKLKYRSSNKQSSFIFSSPQKHVLSNHSYSVDPSISQHHSYSVDPSISQQHHYFADTMMTQDSLPKNANYKWMYNFLLVQLGFFRKESFDL